MEINSKVCSLELSQALDQAGVKIKSEFGWTITENHSQEEALHIQPYECNRENEIEYICSAPLPCELLEVLPERTWIEKFKTGYDITARHIDGLEGKLIRSDDTLANALAKLLLKLIEEKLVEV